MSIKQDTMQQLIYKVQNGDEEAKKQIVNYYTNYTTKIIKEKYNDKDLNKDKLLEAAISAINYSINKYKNTSYQFFCGYIVTNINYCLKKEKKIQQNKYNCKQIQFYIEKALQGDYLAKKEITEYYIKQIDRLIETKYNSEEYDKEELKSAGYIGIAVALKNYRESIKAPFATNVKNYINFYISKEIRYQRNNAIIKPIKNSYDDFIINIENNELIKKAINKLNDRYRNVLILYIYENYSFEKIGKIYNLTRSRIQQIYKKSLEIIKEELTSEPIDKKKIK